MEEENKHNILERKKDFKVDLYFHLDTESALCISLCTKNCNAYYLPRLPLSWILALPTCTHLFFFFLYNPLFVPGKTRELRRNS